MPLTPLNEPGEVDAFGVRFTMEERGRLVRCHVFKSAINQVEGQRTSTGKQLLALFEKHRAFFERLASNLFDSGIQTPWIEAHAVPG